MILWGFYLLFVVTLVIKDKNKLDVHIPYTDIQSTQGYIYIHTGINTHRHNMDAWHTIYMNISQKPAILQMHTNVTQGEPKRRKEAYGIYSYLTCDIFLPLHSSQQTVTQIQVLPTLSLWRHSLCTHWPSRGLLAWVSDTTGTTWEWQGLRMLKRNLRGQAVSKQLSLTCWEHSVVNYWSLKSSGWLDGEMSKAGWEVCWRGRLVAWPGRRHSRELWSMVGPEAHLPAKVTGLSLSG